MTQSATGESVRAELQGAGRLPDQARAKRNRDINPSERLAAAFPALEPLIANPAVSQVFAKYEQDAVRWKKLYTFFGRAALVSVFFVMVFFDYSLTVGRLPSNWLLMHTDAFWLRAFVAAIAAFGLCCQLVLIFGRLKERWQVARYAAERLRCLKFQAFALVAVSRDAAQLAGNVADFTEEGLARLDQELLGGRSALDEFSPSEQLIVPDAHEFCAGHELIRDAFSVYDTLRLEVQAQHFGEQARLSDARTEADLHQRSDVCAWRPDGISR